MRVCGWRGVGLCGRERPFGLCGFEDLWVQCAVGEGQSCRGEAKVGFGAFGVQCVCCGGRGEGGSSALESCSQGVAWRGVKVSWSEGSVARCGVARGWSGVVWCGVVWRDVAWRDVAWRGVVWRGVEWRGVKVAWSEGKVAWCGVA